VAYLTQLLVTVADSFIIYSDGVVATSGGTDGSLESSGHIPL
jgi:hypothetical protein